MPKFSGSKYLISYDNGNNWHLKNVKGFCPHGPLIINNEFYQPLIINKKEERIVKLIKLKSNFKIIEEVGTILITKNDKTGLEEPHLILLNNGKMIVAFRSNVDGYMRICFSNDLGKTWSSPIKTNVKGYPHHLLQLNDGRLLVSYGYRYYPMGIRACISYDNGKTWDIKNEIIIRNDGIKRDLGYPVSIEIENNKIMTIYYINDEKNKNCYIECAVFNLK